MTRHIATMILLALPLGCDQLCPPWGNNPNCETYQEEAGDTDDTLDIPAGSAPCDLIGMPGATYHAWSLSPETDGEQQYHEVVQPSGGAVWAAFNANWSIPQIEGPAWAHVQSVKVDVRTTTGWAKWARRRWSGPSLRPIRATAGS